jgi:hypothetical protein
MKFKESVIKIITSDPRITREQAELILIRLEDHLHKHIQVFDAEKKISWVFIPDILFIDRDNQQRNCTSFVTREQKYTGNMEHECVLDMVKNHNFQVSDNKILVNMAQVKKYDSDRGKIYFEEVVTNDSMFTYVSQRNVNKFKLHLGETADISKIEKINDANTSKFKLPFFLIL